MDQQMTQLLACERKYLAPPEMTEAQALLARIREKLEYQRDRLFRMQEEYKDLKCELNEKQFLNFDLGQKVLESYESKMYYAKEEINDLELALIEREQV